MKSLGFIYLLALLIAGNLTEPVSSNFYQVPPKTQQKKDEQTKEKSKLNLPDVIIYGTERSIRRTGDKLKAHKEGLKLIDHRIEYRPVSPEKSSSMNKLIFLEEQRLSQTATSFNLAYGSFNTPFLKLIRRQQFKYFNYGVNLKYQQSDGQFKNSQYYKGNGKLHFNVKLSSLFNMTLRGELFRSEYGIYGSIIPELKRNLSLETTQLFTQWNFSPKTSSTVELMIRQINLMDNATLNKYKARLEEQTYRVLVNFMKTFASAAQLIVGAEYWGEKYTEFTRSQKFLKLTSNLILPLSYNFSINSAITYEKITFHPKRLSPTLELVFTPTSKIGLAFKGSRYFTPLYFYDLWRQNAYLDSDITLEPIDIKLALEVSLDYKFSNSLTVNVNISKQWIKNYSFWQRDSLNGLFLSKQLEEVAITRLKGGIEYSLSENFTLTSNFIYYIDDIKENSLSTQDTGIPYLENYRVPTKLQIKLPKSISVVLSSVWVSPRRISITSSHTLNKFSFLSIKGEKKLNRHFTVFAKGENLTNSRFELWEGYQELGMRIFIGLRGKW